MYQQSDIYLLIYYLVYISTVFRLLIVFYIFQDLPEHFEENMEKWMKNFLILLTIDSKQLNLEVRFNSLLIFPVELLFIRCMNLTTIDHIKIFKKHIVQFYEKLMSAFYASVFLLMINCGITLSKWLWNHNKLWQCSDLPNLSLIRREN